MRADRLLSALLLLQARGQMTGRELAEHLEVSERTVHRDMEALSSAGVPVFASRGSHGGWQLDEEWQTQVPGLDEAELRALLMAQPRILGDAPLASAARRAMEKLMAAMPASMREHAAFMQQRLHVDTTSWSGATENLSMLPIVQDAVSRDRKLSFRYRKGNEFVERTVHPLGLVAKGGTWYLVALTPDGFRTYRISRMLDAVVLDVPAERPADFELATHWTLSAARFQDELNREYEARRCAILQKLEEEQRIAQEMKIAKQVQTHLFPQTLPTLTTLDYAGICIQARHVGGDYYDFLEMKPGRVALVLADVAGKGISGALLMAHLQANLRSQYATLASIKEYIPLALSDLRRLLHSVNRLFYENSGGSSYATLFFADYDDPQRRLLYVNCGHLPALILRHDGHFDRLDSNCTVLGLFNDWSCTVDECQLSVGDTLILYTDGVTEAVNEIGEEFGEDRLLEALQRHTAKSASELLTSVVQEVQQFSASHQNDDITLIVAKCRAGAESSQMAMF